MHQAVFRIGAANMPQETERAICHHVSEKFGGYTLMHGRGGWTDSAGNLIEERMLYLEIVTSNCPEAIRETAYYLIGRTGEDSILLTIDGQSEFCNAYYSTKG